MWGWRRWGNEDGDGVCVGEERERRNIFLGFGDRRV